MKDTFTIELILLPKVCLVFLLVVGCVGFYWYKGREHNLGITLYIFI